MMLGQSVRILILLLIIGCAGRVGWWSYETIMDLLSFQMKLYEWILTSQQTLTSGQEQLAGVRDSALEFLGQEQHNTDIPLEKISLEEKLAVQGKKLKTIAGSLGIIIGLIVWKILFDIVFGIKKIIEEIKKFVI